jgi:hypothetical protein
VALSAHDDFKRLVIFVPANFACTHTHSFARGAVRGGVYLPSRITFSSKFGWHHRCRLRICAPEILPMLTVTFALRCEDRFAIVWNSRDGQKVILFRRRRPWKYRNH